MVYFQTQKKNNVGKFWRALKWKRLVYIIYSIWIILLPFGIFYGHWVIFLQFSNFSTFWYMYCVKKNLATLM
jgi:hypothetical protein